jgi:hypothetical protein
MAMSTQSRIKLVLAFVAAGCCLGVLAGEPDAKEMAALAEAAKKLPENFNKKPLLFIPFVAEAPKELKGDLSDPAWAKAAVMNFQVSLTAQPIQFKTEARVFCTAEALYLGMRCEEPSLDKLKQDGQVWERDSLEFFIFAGEDSRGKLYSQVVMDAGSDIGFYRCHLYPKQQYRGLHEAWQPTVEHATAKEKAGWTAEMKLKFSDLGKLSAEVENKNTLWRMALYRNRPGRDGEANQAYGWSPTLNTFHHTPQRFGYVMLAPFATPALVETIIERAKPQDKPADAPLADAVVKEIGDLIKKLGSDVFEERQQTQDRLAELIKQNEAQEKFIDEALRKAEAESEDTEIKTRARKLLLTIRDSSDPDEDPPPDSIRNQ